MGNFEKGNSLREKRRQAGHLDGQGVRLNGVYHGAAHPSPGMHISAAAIGHTIIGQNPEHREVKRRPFIIWSQLFDKNGNLVGFEGLGQTANPDVKRYPGQVQIDAASPFYNRHEAIAIKCDLTDYLPNQRPFVNGARSELDPKILPDIILRRVHALLFNPACRSLGLYENIQNETVKTRQGIVLKTVKGADIRCNDPSFSALDVADARVEQMPFTIPGFLEQADIDRISLIARHYSSYCMKGSPRFDIIWPEIGTYPEWPENFLIFEAPQPTHKWIDFSWWPPRIPVAGAPSPSEL